jgi:adenylate cyclase
MSHTLHRQGRAADLRDDWIVLAMSARGVNRRGSAASLRRFLELSLAHHPVNSGDMIAGNIGSSAIMSYTVIGDNVNLGARLESLNKDYKTRIIISEATRGRLGKSYELRPLGGVVVKGKTRPVEIFEVIVPSPLVVSHGASDGQVAAAGEHKEEPV